jgi:hypothetical protein
VSASEGACTDSCHLAVHTIYDIFDSVFITLEVCVYLESLLYQSRLTRDRRVMVSIVRVQQFVPVF